MTHMIIPLYLQCIGCMYGSSKASQRMTHIITALHLQCLEEIMALGGFGTMRNIGIQLYLQCIELFMAPPELWKR